MVEEQKTDVDAVTGATNSSKVIWKTVENALAVGMEDRNEWLNEAKAEFISIFELIIK